MNGHDILLSPGFVENQNWSLGYFFADSQEFILSFVMHATWNKYVNANTVLCAISQKEAKVLKCVLTT